jgi:ATP-dependent DNA ligase
VPTLPHDGFRIMARRDGAGVRLITRHGNDLTRRCLKMQTLLVDLILAAAVGAVFLIALRGKKNEKGGIKI